MQKKYAIVELKPDNYYSLSRAIIKDFSRQMEEMLKPSIYSAVNSLVYRLVDKVSEERYSDSFSKVVEDSVVAALENPEIGISDETLSKLQSDNFELRNKLYDIENRAKQILHILEEIEMSGKPHQIGQINDFINGVAYPKPSRESDNG